MIVIAAAHGVRHYIIALRRGEYVIEALRAWLREQGIDVGLITSGIGSLDICRLHTITDLELPPGERYLELADRPIELASLQGSVAGGEPHLHVVVDDVANGQSYIGHLEPGSRCFARLELGLIAFTDVRTARRVDSTTGLIDIVLQED
jgi:predicted DNA-binding protein with PD1-like motif